MALCAYCGKVEIAWHQVARKWVACHAERDAAGNVVKKDVRDGTRTVSRGVPDTSKRHYPHDHHGPQAHARLASECMSWSPANAANNMKKRGWKRQVPAEPIIEPSVAVAIAEASAEAEALAEAAGVTGPAIAVADAIPTGAVGAKVAAPRVPPPLPEPEALMSKASMAAWARAERAILNEVVPPRVILWGPPGTGKTELPWRIAQERGWTHVYQLMTEETPGTEMLGHLIVQGGSTVWCDGTLGRAIRASETGPVVLVIDEIARASQDAMSACLLALTNPESLRLTLRSGEVLAPVVANWHVVATSNDEPAMLPPALADRLHISVMLTHPHPGLVRSLTTAEARRLACAESREYSVRALLTYDRLRASGMSMEDAAELTWEPEVASSFVDAARVERGVDHSYVPSVTVRR